MIFIDQYVHDTIFFNAPPSGYSFAIPAPVPPLEVYPHTTSLILYDRKTEEGTYLIFAFQGRTSS